jgi:hypothetical protein
MSIANSYKFVALINKNLDAGVALNALGHAALGLGAHLADGQKEAMRLLEFRDGDGQAHANISALSLIVLRGTSANIRALRREAIARSIACVEFASTMTGDTYVEQLERTAQTPESELDYYAILLFGPAEILNPLTRKYSLYRTTPATAKPSDPDKAPIQESIVGPG